MSDVKDKNLASKGKLRIEWAGSQITYGSFGKSLCNAIIKL